MKALRIVIGLLYTGLIGGIMGFVTWLFLLLVTDGIHLFWDSFILKKNSDILIMTICIIGGVLVGLCEKYIGRYPKTMEMVLKEYKTTGSVEYKSLKKSIVKIFTVLWFGGTVGPEAALTGIIGGGTSLIGELIKFGYKRKREETTETRGIKRIFEVPIYGFYNFVEEKDIKNYKKFIYSVGVAAGIIIFFILAKMDSKVSFITRFPKVILDKKSLELFIPIFLIGALMVIYSMVLDKIIPKIFSPLRRFKILNSIVGGIILGLFSISLPLILFSGEHSVKKLLGSTMMWGALIFILISLVKMLSCKICIETGWIGGPIFPIMFSGVALSIALFHLTGVNLSFAAAILMSTMVSGILKNFKISVILVICFFSINAWIFILISAFASEKLFKKIEKINLAK